MGKIEKSWTDNDNVKKNALAYQQWFDSCDSLDHCTKNGFIDFTARIFTTDFYDIIGDPRGKTCMEIGSGGGRLLNAACKFFKFGYGVDILTPESFGMTKSFMSLSGTDNFKLLHKDSAGSILDNSVDFVYSFIVFQHFDSWAEVTKYLDLISRVLKPGGAGVVYFGLNKENDQDILVTKDKDFNDRACSLYVSKGIVEKEISKRFLFSEISRGTKQPWNKKESGQFYVKFKARK